MKTLFIILFSALMLGCASDGQLLNTTAGQVAEGNIFSFRDTVVKVNPGFKFLRIKEKHKMPGDELDTGFPDIYQIENLYLFIGVDDYNRVTKAAMINLVSLSDSHMRWDHRVDLFKTVKTIQKGKETIDGKEYWYFVHKLLAVPETVYFALEDEGYRIKNFKCGISKTYWKVLGNDGGVVLMITYLKGLHHCNGLENDSQELSTYWEKIITDFSAGFSENVNISHN